jgi:hypothetical protein
MRSTTKRVMDQARPGGQTATCQLREARCGGAHEAKTELPQEDGVGGDAVFAFKDRFCGPGQWTAMRPTYVTQPRAPVTFSVSPPPRVTRHESSCPRVTAETGVPPIASRVRVGANVSSARSVVPRATRATFVDAEIGAPQRDPQHHEEIASGTRPELVAR